MKAAETWELIHEERAAMVETWTTIADAQWSMPSWCKGWTTKQVAGHIVAAAEQTPLNFSKQLTRAGFKFDVFTDRDAKRLGALSTDELIARLRARTSTTNHPPAPVMAMLGEIVVHGEDIRRPLGIDHTISPEALVAVAESYKRSNLLIGSKRRIAGLSLSSTDVDWSTGSGPEVAGPMTSLILAMSGRVEAAGDLSGEGLKTLIDRC
jgi:uncharacterized protein (TIGR03083 family)